MSMAPQDIRPGIQVKVVGKPWGDQGPEILVVEKYPIRGLYHDYVLCRWNDRPLYFLPDELLPVEDPQAPTRTDTD